ncbi:shikimate kinase [Deinococcus kurensis]|uniref:shikimate kinase n=1 Tax=Deinococcus kurensis TaxID=2662757 RepID=UPI0012D2D086|nr:AAA family ATPase [Deinococcus kurensis]
MPAVLLTGMSGAGKSAALLALARRGYRVVDTDAGDWNEWVQAPDGPDWVWRLDRLHALLDEVGSAPLVLAGCRSNQGALYPRLRAVVLLTAPLPVLLARVQHRENPYGRTAEDRARIAEHVAWVEPLLRRSATLVLDTARLSVAQVADQVEALLRDDGLVGAPQV